MTHSAINDPQDQQYDVITDEVVERGIEHADKDYFNKYFVNDSEALVLDLFVDLKPQTKLMMAQMIIHKARGSKQVNNMIQLFAHDIFQELADCWNKRIEKHAEDNEYFIDELRGE